VTRGARFLAICCAASWVLIVPATAGATASSSLGNGSGVDQYLEQIHTAGGAVHPGVGKNNTTPIDGKSRGTLGQVSKPAQVVLNNAMSSTWAGGSGPKLARTKTPGSSLVGSMLGSIRPRWVSGNRLIVLLVAIVSITAVLGIAAARKQRALHVIIRR